MSKLYELTGSAAGYIAVSKMTDIAKAIEGITSIKERHQFGWTNQPMTIEFIAESKDKADRVALEVSACITPPAQLGPRLFAFPVE